MYAPNQTSLRKELPYRYSTPEKIKVGERMADLLKEIETLEAQKKQAASEFKDHIDKKMAELKKLGANLQAGEEMRLIECEIRRNFKHGTGRLVRMDTHETVEEWNLTSEEREIELDFQGDGEE